MDERSVLLLSQLIHHKGYLPIEEITDKLQISRRTLYYDLKKANQWLKDQGLEHITNVRSLGLSLPENSKQKIPALMKDINTQQYYFSEKERKNLLAVSLITTTVPLFLKDLMDKIKVSRGTTIQEMNRLKGEFTSFQLKLEFHRVDGYVVEGEERQKRKALLYYLSHILTNNGWNQLLNEIQVLLNGDLDTEALYLEKHTLSFIHEYFPFIEQLVTDSVTKYGLQITDEMYQQLSLRLLVFSKRLLEGNSVQIQEEEKEVLRTTAEYEVATYIAKHLEQKFQVPFPEDEIAYLTMHLLGISIRIDPYDLDHNEVTENLKWIIEKMVFDFQRYACVFFQDSSQLKENLLKHLKQTYYRLKYDLAIDNPLIGSIQESYGEVLELTKKVVHHLEAYMEKPLNEDEIGFLAMYFGGWLKREGTTPQTRKKAMIVCGNGVSTSQLLQSQIENLLTTVDVVSILSLREFNEHTPYDVDFIVSTIPIKHRIPVFHVNPILTDLEKETLLNQFNLFIQRKSKSPHYSIPALMDIIQKYADIKDEAKLVEDLTQFLSVEKRTLWKGVKPVLEDLLTPDMIQLNQETDDWKSAIRIASQPLLKKGAVQDEYVEAMIQNVLELGPYVVIAPKIAIPHARPEQGVKQMGMSLLTLKEGVLFEKSDNPVQLMIVLAAVDKESHLKALAQLSTLLSNEEDVKRIIEATDNKTVLDLIAKYSQV
ncbi:BglG family transcription antiterminator [Shimazuella sp. AN120528]|uniref:BglG family transcription antiterminator n=1 Tax=Shimazuella soli TaxID=1892854 RepID=UPI001F0E3147|nr:BglG family transcription antiterminator [Shimazuella soli]MCH5586169.1 BglG family transcription antiterminator [Shimazuella soli]